MGLPPSVGYARRLVITGFHPLDGARFLRDEHHVDARVVRLVANRPPNSPFSTTNFCRMP
ncbi:hypothetical protein [Nocardia sp. CNY236]|uniref:hypothetical protein n=1 Tax=Nocardia sp. CNY236 TaxID=1169152 RepID=UPI00048D97FC|nr:hypothetical protein [Nocardia sp. CNY236]